MARGVNKGLQIQITRTGGTPSLLGEVKDYLQIDSEDHDSLLGQLILSAVERIESYCGVTIIPSIVSAFWRQLSSIEPLPYGPVVDVLDESGGEVIGIVPGFASVEPSGTGPVRIDYAAGYSIDPDTPISLPEGLRLAIIKLVTDDFEQRTGVLVSGREAVQILPNNWKDSARPYRRASWVM